MKIIKNLEKFVNNMNLKKTRIIAGILTLFIISLLIFAGPVQAFILGLTIDNNSLIKGEKVTFNASLEIESMDKYLPAKNLTLEIKGPTSSTCIFNLNGNNPLQGCEDMTITPINFPDENEKGYGYGYGYDSEFGYGYDFGYGYGYGYGYGQGGKKLYYLYEIVLDTTNYQKGGYVSQLKAIIGGETFESKDKPIFTINTPANPGGGGGNNNDDNNDDGTGFQTLGLENNGKEENNKSSNPEIENNESQDENKGFLSSITGAIIGGGRGKVTIPIIFVVLTFISTLIVYTIKKRKVK